LLAEAKIAANTIASNALSNWLQGTASVGNLYCDPSLSYPIGGSGIPRGWESWVYGATDTGETITMYNKGVTETVIVGTSAYGTCYSMQGWAGFRTLAQMHELGYSLQEQIAVTMYKLGKSYTIYKVDAGGNDGFTETMYNNGSRLVPLSLMHYIQYSYGAQTQISAYRTNSAYGTYETVTLYAVSANEDDGFTETMYSSASVILWYSDFHTLDWLHQYAYSLEQPTAITMYHWEDAITTFSCAANGADGFTETMYIISNSWKTISEANEAGYFLTPTPNPNT
jgi:hypothetical protein